MRARPALLAALSALACAVELEPARPAVAFGSYGSASGQFAEPQGIAVDQESGDVFVMDSDNHRVDEFTARGGFVRAWGWGVADGHTLALQTCTSDCHAGLPGEGAGQFGFAEGVAVDDDPASPSHHDVYVVDISNHRVEKFSPTGRLLLMFGGAVNVSARERHEPAGEDICPVRPGDRCGPGAVGPGPGEFEFPVEGDFVAVGRTGTVYVGDRNRVQEFGSNGTYESQLRLTPAPETNGPEAGGTQALVVEASGDLFVVRNGVEGVREYGPSGEPLLTLDELGEPEWNWGPTPALALGPDGSVFIDEFFQETLHRVLRCDGAGELLASFDANLEDALHGLAFDERSDWLYAVYTNGNVTPLVARVRILTPPPPSPGALSGFGISAWCSGP